MHDAVHDAVLETFESCRVGGDAIPMRWPKRCAAPCALRVAQRWGKKPMCHVHVLTV